MALHSASLFKKGEWQLDNFEEVKKLAEDIYSLKAKWTLFKAEQGLLDSLGGMLGSMHHSLDEEEKAADEDLAKLCSITERRTQLRASEPKIDQALVSMKQSESVLIDETIALLDNIILYAKKGAQSV